MNDELDAFLDAGKARYGGVGLATALDEAATWAETRAARRRRGAHTWIAVGILAGLLGGGTAVATAMSGGDQPQVMGTSVLLAYTASSGAVCQLEIRPVVRTADPSVRGITLRYLENVDVAKLDNGRGADALVEALSRGAEQEILRLRGAAVDVTLLADHSCSTAPSAGDEYGVTPPIVGDDFSREPTLQPGRAPDLVGFFRASTGQICEIQMKINPDWMNDATDERDASMARAFVATIDVTTVDYSAALAEAAEGTPPSAYPAQDEAAALLRTLSQLASTLGDPSGEHALSITTEGWAFCDPEPAE